MVACTSTWLEYEREEFEAEKRAAAEDPSSLFDPPAWVYSDMKLEPDVPFYDHDYQRHLDCLVETTTLSFEEECKPCVTRSDDKSDILNIMTHISNIIPSDSSNTTPDSSNIPPDSSNTASDLSNIAPDFSNIPSDFPNIPPDLSNIPSGFSNIPPGFSNIPPGFSSRDSSLPRPQSAMTTIVRTSESGKIKLLIKRPKDPVSSVETAPPAVETAPPAVATDSSKKISLKLKMSANKWVSVAKGTNNAGESSRLSEKVFAPAEDVATQSAVESILQMSKEEQMALAMVKQEELQTTSNNHNNARSGTSLRHTTTAQPVIANGSVAVFSTDNYFYTSQQTFVETETEDSALDEAIQSILG